MMSTPPQEVATASVVAATPSPDTGGCVTRVARRNSIGISPNEPVKQRVKILENLQAISQTQRRVSKLLMGHDIGQDTSLRIVHGILKLQRTHIEEHNKLPVARRSTYPPAKI